MTERIRRDASNAKDQLEYGGGHICAPDAVVCVRWWCGADCKGVSMKTLCVDLDGVLAQYDGWKGEPQIRQAVSLSLGRTQPDRRHRHLRSLYNPTGGIDNRNDKTQKRRRGALRRPSTIWWTENAENRVGGTFVMSVYARAVRDPLREYNPTDRGPIDGCSRLVHPRSEPATTRSTRRAMRMLCASRGSRGVYGAYERGYKNRIPTGGIVNWRPNRTKWSRTNPVNPIRTGGIVNW